MNPQLLELLSAAGSSGTQKLYVEDVFSTYLYTGNGSTQTITNGLDVSGQGGLVWVKSRSAATDHALYDTVRGATFDLASNNTTAQTTQSTGLTEFTRNGFSIGSLAKLNTSAATYTSWTFRKAPKFFDVVTWTGNGVSGRQIAHNLGVAPGCIIYKCTSNGPTNWLVLHRGLPNGFSDGIFLNTTDAAFSLGGSFAPTDTTFTMSNGDLWNRSGYTYVAYLFAHDATADGIIQCGSFTTDSGGLATVNLGWEPQWLLVKRTNAASSWFLVDNMRGFFAPSTNANGLFPESSQAEAAGGVGLYADSTGFSASISGVSHSYVYIAIRRGPMKTPTVGTSVFSPDFFGGGTVYWNSGFPTDMAMTAQRAGDTYNTSVADRLRGGNNTLVTSNTSAEFADTTNYFANMVGFGLPYTGGTDTTYIGWLFRRAPGFFDVVCYTGTGVARTVNHNLGVAPELMIVKGRSQSGYNWVVYSSSLAITQFMMLSSTNAVGSYDFAWNGTAPTATQFSLRDLGGTNDTGQTYIAYLFASAPGVSKVGSYTGNGSSQTINCGFSSGARFFLVKRTDSTGDWWVYDSARGIVAAADPALTLNSTAAEVTSADAVDTDSTGIIVNQEATCNINVNGATYIYLAIA